MSEQSEKHGAQSDKATEARTKAAERPVDQDPLFIQLKEQLAESKTQVSRLSARNLDLEATNKLLEGESGRMAVIAMRGGVKIEAFSQVMGALPSLYDAELQDVVLECNQEIKQRNEKKDSKRKTERRKVIEKNSNGARG